MEDISREIVYFARPGQENTDRTLTLAKKRADELGITGVVVASTTGETGVKATQIFGEYNLVVVTHSTGFSIPDAQELRDENRQAMLARGVKILTGQHALGGVGRAIRKKWGTYELEEIIAHTLRLFGEGVKVACEIVLMAADAGLVNTGEEVVAMGGTAKGADTALVIKPANVHSFFDLRIKEVICKPRL